jgi:hypothetical protein
VTTTSAAPVGPPPPVDDECGAVLAGLPPFPPLTAETIRTSVRAWLRLLLASDVDKERTR